MSNKFDGDVRPLSNDPRYMGKPFHGRMSQAIKQAKRAPDHGMPENHGPERGISRDRANLLEHLGLPLPFPRKPPKRAASPFSLAHAIARWPECFLVDVEQPV